MQNNYSNYSEWMVRLLSEKREKNVKNDKGDVSEEDKGYLFSIEVLIKGRTNGHALEMLTHLMNDENVTDYRIIKGINLGQIIAANMNNTNEQITPPTSEVATDHKLQNMTVKKEIKADKKSSESKNNNLHQLQPIIQQIEQFKEAKSLIRLTLNKGKGVKLSIPCRILNFDLNSGNITAYHVDEKKVYSVNLNEIDELVSG